jgi:hypothetical protein
MSIYIMSRIKIFKKLGDNTWDTTGEELTEAILGDVTLGMGQKKDTFKFKITNTENNLFRTFFSGNGSQTIFNLIHYPIPTQLQTDPDRFVVLVDDEINNDWTIDNGAGTITFDTAPSSGTNNIQIRYPVIEVDDRITIEQWKEAGSPSAQDLLIDGIVKTPIEEIGDVGRMFSVGGASWIESLFATLIPIDVNGTPPEIIGGSQVTSGKTGVLDMIALGNPTRQVFWHPNNPIDKDGNTIEQGEGDNPFPDKHYVQNYKAANEIIEEVSSNDYTEDGPYFITVVTETTPDNDPVLYLKWLPKGTDTDHIFTEGVEPTNIKIDKKGDEIINAIIYPLGKDAYNISRHDVNFDAVSIGKFGQKWKYITSTGQILNDLLQAEIASDEDKSKFNYDAQGNPIDLFPVSYPYTIVNFNDRDDETGADLGTAITVDNDAEYNQAIRKEAKWVGKQQTQRILDKLANPRYFVTLELPFTTDYTIGNVAEVTIPSYNFENKKLRLVQIKYDPFKTILSLEEDEKTIGVV